MLGFVLCFFPSDIFLSFFSLFLPRCHLLLLLLILTFLRRSIHLQYKWHEKYNLLIIKKLQYSDYHQSISIHRPRASESFYAKAMQTAVGCLVLWMSDISGAHYIVLSMFHSMVECSFNSGFGWILLVNVLTQPCKWARCLRPFDTSLYQTHNNTCLLLLILPHINHTDTQ